MALPLPLLLATAGANKSGDEGGFFSRLFQKKEPLTSEQKFNDRGFTSTFLRKKTAWANGQPETYGKDFHHFLTKWDEQNGTISEFGQPSRSNSTTKASTHESFLSANLGTNDRKNPFQGGANPLGGIGAFLSDNWLVVILAVAGYLFLKKR